MSFGLKNAGATYQRAIQLYFTNQLHRNMEVYVDDVVVKIKEYDSFISDLEETFNSLRSFRWKMNPTKCVFGVPSEKLLGFIISHRGIEANPEKINAIMNMEAPASIKDVQKITGCMAALNRFLSKLGGKRTSFLQATQEARQVPMVSRSNRCTQRPQAAPSVASCPYGPNARRVATPLYYGYHTRREHDNRGRT
jgi:hypothetical protein